MPLNLETRASGDFVPFIKYNAKAGRWFAKSDTGDEFEVKNMTAIFDLANIKTGWILFAEGMAPSTQWDNGAVAPQPTPSHRRGFSVNVFSPQQIGGLRELSATSNVMIVAIKELHAAYEAAPEAAKGLVPVVTCESVTPIKGARDTNYAPHLAITKWVPRPQAMGAADAQEQVPLPLNSAEPKERQLETAGEEF